MGIVMLGLRTARGARLGLSHRVCVGLDASSKPPGVRLLRPGSMAGTGRDASLCVRPLHHSAQCASRLPTPPPGRGGPARSKFYARNPFDPYTSRVPQALPGGRVWVRVPLSEQDKELARVSTHLPVEEVALPCGSSSSSSAPSPASSNLAPSSLSSSKVDGLSAEQHARGPSAPPSSSPPPLSASSLSPILFPKPAQTDGSELSPSSPARITRGPSAGGAPLGAVRQVPFAHIPNTPHPPPEEHGFALPPLARPVGLALVAASLAVCLAAYVSVESTASLAQAVRKQERENSTGGKLMALLRGLGGLTSFVPATLSSGSSSPPSANPSESEPAPRSGSGDSPGFNERSSPSPSLLKPSPSFPRDKDAYQPADLLDDPFLGVGEARLQAAHTHTLAALLGQGLKAVVHVGKELNVPFSWMQNIVSTYLKASEEYLSLSPGHAATIVPLLTAFVLHMPFKIGPMNFRLWLLDRMAHAPGARVRAFIPRPPEYWRWMREKAHEASQKVPRIHTVLTSGWTHISTLHLVANGVAIYSIGSIALDRSMKPTSSGHDTGAVGFKDAWMGGSDNLSPGNLAEATRTGILAPTSSSSSPSDAPLSLFSTTPQQEHSHASSPVHVPESSLIPLSFAVLFGGAAVGGAVSHLYAGVRARLAFSRLLGQWAGGAGPRSTNRFGWQSSRTFRSWHSGWARRRTAGNEAAAGSGAANANKLTQELMQKYSSLLTRHSLGLSGGAYTLVILVTMETPDTQVVGPHTLFTPISIATSTAILVSLDLTGLVLGWRMFDHAAHLGGAAFGWFWFVYGQEAYERIKAVWARRLARRLARQQSDLDQA